MNTERPVGCWNMSWNSDEIGYLLFNQLTVKYCFDMLQIVEKPSELDIPQESHSDETEKTLIERIKSIKQEK